MSARYAYMALLVAVLALGWGLGIASSQRVNTAAAQAYTSELLTQRIAVLTTAHAQALAHQAEAHAIVRRRLEQAISEHRGRMWRAGVRLPAWRDE